MTQRCINLDWLEVYCIEDYQKPRDVNYFTSCGYDIKVRAYGSPQYAQMFTLYENEDEFVEIRREPYSTTDAGGIFPRGACHIRLCNRTCYERDPIGHLRMFLITHGYQFKAISRIDIALDFVDFDNPEWSPRTFVAAYMRGEVSKVNQSNVAAHGRDYWANRIWNSLKWGSNSSAITTKFYNKTLELKEAEAKAYIRTRWAEAGFPPNAEVWRIEFAASSQMQTLQSLATGATFVRNLSSYETRERLLFQWQVYSQKYFDFRKVIHNQNGTLKRKYECPKLNLFTFADSAPYKPMRNVARTHFVGRTWTVLANKIKPMLYDTSMPKEVRDAAYVMLSIILQKRAEEWCDVDAMRRADALQLEAYRQGVDVERLREDVRRRDEQDRQLMYALLKRYGIRIQDETCPF